MPLPRQSAFPFHSLGGSQLMFEFEAFCVADTEPPLLCVTFTVLELLADASPLLAVALDVPVFVPAFVFVAEPPALPAELSPVPPAVMFPSWADESAFWPLALMPSTPDLAELKPEFAIASWNVPTDDPWLTVRSAELSRVPPPLMLELSAVCVASTLPSLLWPTVASALLVADAFPDVAEASEPRVFLPALPLLAVPPSLPAVLSPVPPALMLPS